MLKNGNMQFSLARSCFYAVFFDVTRKMFGVMQLRLTEKLENRTDYYSFHYCSDESTKRSLIFSSTKSFP